MTKSEGALKDAMAVAECESEKLKDEIKRHEQFAIQQGASRFAAEEEAKKVKNA